MFIATVSCGPMACADDHPASQAEERAVTYERMGLGDYQNFLGNWDEKAQPVLYALIQTPAQYDALFHPAPVMGNKRPFAPGAELYAKEWILLVARVMKAPGDWDKVFAVERLTERDRDLELHYRFNEPGGNATWTAKDYMALRIPRGDYNKVTFFENGKLIGELNLSKGDWSVPKLTAEAGKPDAVVGQ